ncbi:MAG: Nramp family divalent metal transporter [Actinobacteria bacterium]|nr:Nramp family divalent metal transporter [Actinomycetota bacterium]
MVAHPVGSATEGVVADVTEDAGAARRETATEVPSRYLPSVSYRDLPEALPLKRIVGPSVVLLAVSIGSGEFVLWPFISSRFGTTLLWIAALGILTQYFINMEIERYTLATGETAVTGFTRLWKQWSWLFIIMTIVPWVWPGWATGASTTAGFVFGWESGTVNIVTVLGLTAIGIALTASPIVYNFVEKFQMVMVGAIFVFLLFAVVMATQAEAWTSLFQPARPAFDADLTPAVLLGALAFAGAGGSVNLAQSNWIRDKGLGMGAHIPRIESPLTGEPMAIASVGHTFRSDEDNLRRWREWWRVANQEQFWFFFVLGLISIIVLSVLTASTVFGQELEGGFAFIEAEGEVLAERIGTWFRTFFWLAGAVVLFSTNLGVLDHVGRVVADIVKINWLRDSEFWSESKLYFAIVWGEIILGAVILLTAIDQPLLLLVIASSLNGLVMFVYSILLIQLNRTAVPAAVKITGVRLGAMGWSVLFFGFFSAILLQDQFGKLVGG